MTSRLRLRTPLTLALLCAVTLVGAAAALQRSTPAEPQANGEPSTASAIAPGTAGMTVHIDPETGALGPGFGPVIPILDQQTQNALRRDSIGLQQEFHPDGSVSVDLQGRFQNASLAKLGDDGPEIICTEHADRASSFLECGHDGHEPTAEEK